MILKMALLFKKCSQNHICILYQDMRARWVKVLQNNISRNGTNIYYNNKIN